MNRPKYLYKYSRFNEMWLTEQPSIWFSRPILVNDPFEFKYRISYSASDEQLKNWVIRNGYTLPSDTTQLRVMFITASQDCYKQIYNQLLTERGLWCASETNNDILMWSHYADHHRGVCLEYDSSCFTSGNLFKVNYQLEIPSLDPTKELVEGRFTPFNIKLLEPFVNTKSICWQYEREWRLLHVEGDILFHLPEGSLTGIYIGCNISDNNKRWIIDKFKKTSVNLYTMSVDYCSYSLKTTQI